MEALSIFSLVVIGIIALVIIGLLAAFTKFYVKVPQGWALIINDMTDLPKVKFTGGIVWPIINKKELMKISLITLEIDRKNKEGLICHDNIRADISVSFYLRVNETQEDVLKVAKSIGVDRASDKAAVNELFNAKFAEALKTVGKQMDFVDLLKTASPSVTKSSKSSATTSTATHSKTWPSTTWNRPRKPRSTPTTSSTPKASAKSPS